MEKTGLLLIVLFISGCAIAQKHLAREIENARSVKHQVSPIAIEALRAIPISVPVSHAVGVVDYPDENIFEIIIGPVDLPKDEHRTMLFITSMPSEIWLHGFDWTITDSSGRELPRKLLHHINLIETEKREIFSPIARRIVAAGRETPPTSLPHIFGVPVKADSPLLVVAMLENNDGPEYGAVSIRLWLSYSTGKTRLVMPRIVIPFYLDAAGFTGDKDFDVPPGPSIRSWDASPIIDGRIVALGGHLHKYGQALMLEDVTESAILWKVRPEVSKNGDIVRVPSSLFLFSGGKRLFREHIYRIAVEYLNPLDGPSPERGMGTIGGLFFPEGPAGWDQPDYSDPTYVADMKYLEQTYSGGMHMHGSEKASSAYSIR